MQYFVNAIGIIVIIVGIIMIILLIVLLREKRSREEEMDTLFYMCMVPVLNYCSHGGRFIYLRMEIFSELFPNCNLILVC